MVREIIVCLTLALCIGIHTGHAQDKPQGGKMSETLVCKIEPSVKPEAFRTSRDGKRVAYEAIMGAKRILVVDGKEKADWNFISGDFFISGLVFSPDGKRVAYERFYDGKHVIVVETEGEEPYEIPFSGHRARIVFSPDGKRLAIRSTGSSAGGQFMIVDGKREKAYQLVSYPSFSSDSRRILYLAKEQGKVFMVLDGKEEKPGPDIVKASLSPGGDRVVYVASRNNKVSVVLDGQEGPQYDEITDMVFSPDGKRLAYIARQGDQWCAVIDGKQGKGYGDYWTDTLLFSPDGRRVAYMAAESKPWKIKALGETKMMVKGEGAPPKNRPKWVVVVDGKEEKPFDYGTPYIKDGGWEKPKADGTLVFSPNSRRMAYVALSGQIMKMKVKNGPKVMELEGGLTKWFVIVDGKKEKEFDEVREGSIVFSPDNRHVAYVAKAKDKWAVVVDGKERKSYDRIVSYGGRVIFDSADKLSYLAREGSDIYLVEESLN